MDPRDSRRPSTSSPRASFPGPGPNTATPVLCMITWAAPERFHAASARRSTPDRSLTSAATPMASTRSPSRGSRRRPERGLDVRENHLGTFSAEDARRPGRCSSRAACDDRYPIPESGMALPRITESAPAVRSQFPPPLYVLTGRMATHGSIALPNVRRDADTCRGPRSRRTRGKRVYRVDASPRILSSTGHEPSTNHRR